MTRFEDDFSNPYVADPMRSRIGLTFDALNPHDPQHTRRFRGNGGAGSNGAEIITHRAGERHVTRVWLAGRCVGEFYEGGDEASVLRTDGGTVILEPATA